MLVNRGRKSRADWLKPARQGSGGHPAAHEPHLEHSVQAWLLRWLPLPCLLGLLLLLCLLCLSLLGLLWWWLVKQLGNLCFNNGYPITAQEYLLLGGGHQIGT
jgi:hypothetical protein